MVQWLCECDKVKYFVFKISLLNPSWGLLILMENTDRSYILVSCTNYLVKEVRMQM